MSDAAKTPATDLRAPLGRARGLGSTKHGAGHWRWQRVTAVLLVPLGLWFAWVMVELLEFGFDHSVFRAWASEPGNALLMTLFVVAMFHHAALGLQVVIEDYVHGTTAKTVTLFASNVGMAILGLSSVLAVLRLSLGV